MHIKVLTFVILLILDVPNPLAWSVISLLRPHIFIFVCAFDLIGFYPVLRDILLVASANGAAFGFTQLLHVGQRAIRINIDAQDTKVFSFHKLMQIACSFVVELSEECLLIVDDVKRRSDYQCNENSKEHEGKYLECSI